MHEQGVPDYAVIHFNLNCDCLEQLFILSGYGPKRKTLKQLRHLNELDDIIDKSTQKIQRGKM